MPPGRRRWHPVDTRPPADLESGIGKPALKRSLHPAGRRTWTLVLVLALLLSHGLGTTHSHASPSPGEASQARARAACWHQDSSPHLDPAPSESGFCLVCALLAQSPSSSPIREVQALARTVEIPPAWPLLPPARPLNLARPGRSPPAA